MVLYDKATKLAGAYSATIRGHRLITLLIAIVFTLAVHVTFLALFVGDGLRRRASLSSDGATMTSNATTGDRWRYDGEATVAPRQNGHSEDARTEAEDVRNEANSRRHPVVGQALTSGRVRADVASLSDEPGRGRPPPYGAIRNIRKMAALELHNLDPKSRDEDEAREDWTEEELIPTLTQR